ncbi:HNH endonuclease signature motif containing protein [Viridibacillus arvi]|uniref:HNH endonuclease signature motif containing protein n=1 Tax=Viridibacillus arvi TaxID=263475 RepID=UPI00187B971A|nr:HNH endonuclease signature motif containing protein [Viridibacillus sp. JNUCC-6]QOV11041.1 HNH endonuclease [Viridibacillus sp. JNUCC-6]
MLLTEVENMCPLCTTELVYKKGVKYYQKFEAAHIYPLNPSQAEIEILKDVPRLSEDVNNLDNFIALCESCHHKFDNPRTREEYIYINKIKKSLLERSKLRSNYHYFQLEDELMKIIRNLINETNYDEDSKLDNKALKIDGKISVFSLISF